MPRSRNWFCGSFPNNFHPADLLSNYLKPTDPPTTPLLLPVYDAQRWIHRTIHWHIIIVLIRQQGQDRTQRVDLLSDFHDLEFLLFDDLVDVPHGQPPP